MIERIYASKLYRASTRKDKIRAAIANPLNLELVTQITDALDSPYQKPEFVDKEHDKPKFAEDDNHEDDSNNIKPSENTHGGGGGGPHSSGGPIPGLSEGEELVSVPQNEDDLRAIEDSLTGGSSEPAPAEDVAESSDVPNTLSTVTASEDLEVKHCDIEAIKGLLNNVAETTGVARIQVKENEVWIYYNDDVNLNNVMTSVIEGLISEGYDLEFNRLARSDNAIVFESVIEA